MRKAGEEEGEAGDHASRVRADLAPADWTASRARGAGRGGMLAGRPRRVVPVGAARRHRLLRGARGLPQTLL